MKCQRKEHDSDEVAWPEDSGGQADCPDHVVDWCEVRDDQPSDRVDTSVVDQGQQGDGDQACPVCTSTGQVGQDAQE